MSKRFKKLRFLILGLLLVPAVLLTNPAAIIQAETPEPTKRIIGYFTNWSIYRGHNQYYPEYVPFDKITHINYAFAKTLNGQIALSDEFADINKSFDGDVYNQDYKGCFNQFRKFKQLHPHFKILISVGGWSMSGDFSNIALTDVSRTLFADSCISFLRQYTFFDGIDIDWEYPVGGGLDTNVYRPEDKQNFTLLMAKLREKLTAAGTVDGRQYLLTAAMPAGYDIMPNFEINLLHQYVDWLNLMTYDYHGVWDTITNHHSPLFANPNDPTPDLDKRSKYNIDWTVNEYLRLGVPLNKINIGSPYYSRGWSGVTGGTNGLFGNNTGGATGIWDDRGVNAGINPFYYVKGTLETNGYYVKYRDPFSKVPWLWSAGKKIMYTYEDEVSIAEKAQYVLDKNLGGLMFWEFSGDYPSHGDTLTTAVYNKFAPVGPPMVNVFYDGFESGDFSSGGWYYGGCVIQGSYKYAGNNAVELSSADYLTKALNTSGYNNVQISYARYTISFRKGDHLYIEWYDGSTWRLLEDIGANSAWTVKILDLPVGAGNNPDFQIRYRAATGSRGVCYVDEVKINVN